LSYNIKNIEFLKLPKEKPREFDLGLVARLDETDKSDYIIHEFKKDLFCFSEVESFHRLEINNKEISSSSTHNDYYGLMTCFKTPLEEGINKRKEFGESVRLKCYASIETVFGVFVDHPEKDAFLRCPTNWYFLEDRKDFDNLKSYIEKEVWGQEEDYGVKKVKRKPLNLIIYDSNLNIEQNVNLFKVALLACIGMDKKTLKDRVKVYRDIITD
jgi:hypothetical protein